MGAVRGQAAAAVLAVCGILALSACQNGDDPAAAPDAKPSAAAPAAPSGGAEPSAGATAAVPAPSKTGAAPKPSATATPAGKNPPAPAPPPAPSCGADHRMPVSPDTIAVQRYTPEGGMTSLIVQHGTYGCPGRFEPSGPWTYIPISEKAKITATAPILGPGTVMGKPISTSELTGWLDTHPDKGLPFHYHLNAEGVIDTLDEIYVK
ncbi:hypothetical protein EDD96_0626 [Streptomyces sp. Ag109_G2-6]|uniref:hypothetical protein n=1 Tax=Streptomyces sp. Ag109_G2-6 TaxID=2485154 RepID=UPI000C2BC7B9|nr:hypothetical protein [Streptomyces sp. Ag109_G2-6]RPF44108.1 hypothetical protein EDD96_0626 [Streptomyces sp. Ag109_G2-6]